MKQRLMERPRRLFLQGTLFDRRIQNRKPAQQQGVRPFSLIGGHQLCQPRCLADGAGNRLSSALILLAACLAFAVTFAVRKRTDDRAAFDERLARLRVELLVPSSAIESARLLGAWPLAGTADRVARAIDELTVLAERDPGAFPSCCELRTTVPLSPRREK